MHNILITGGSQSDRIEAALMVAKGTLCNEAPSDEFCNRCQNCQKFNSNSHPNIFFISISPPCKKYIEEDERISLGKSTSFELIKIDQVRQIVSESQKKNFAAGSSLFIITHMHQVTKSAGNALLKVMEESSEKKIFIALAPSRKSVLSTIASRLVCRPIRPSALPTMEENDEQNKKIFQISQTPLTKRFMLCAYFNSERDGLQIELDLLAQACHTLVRQKKIPFNLGLGILEALLFSQDNLRKNLNTKIIIENLLFDRWPFSRSLK